MPMLSSIFVICERAFSIVFGSNGRNHEAEQLQRMKKICALKNQLEKLNIESTAFNQEIMEKQQALFKGREECDKLR